jgi:Spy/CpxP family protein refolding chaperone
MKSKYRELRLIILVAITAFVICGISNRFLIPSAPGVRDPDNWLEAQLKLTDTQVQQLAGIEARYDQQKIELSAKIRTANAELAAAILEDKRYSKRVEKAQAAIHAAQGEMQRATLEHFFELQPHLTPEQRETLNAVAVNALYHNP